MSTIPSVCVYCGSRDGANPSYAQAAVDTGTMLARNNWRLVYGAGDVGLMGRVAQATELAGGKTFGVIPQHLMEWEVGRKSLDTLIVTETMHERKKVMFYNAQAIVVLPGGAGTMDEMFEALTWRQLELHAKPIYLLNTGGYWGPLLGLLYHIVDQGFADAGILKFIETVPDIATLEEKLQGALAENGADDVTHQEQT